MTIFYNFCQLKAENDKVMPSKKIAFCQWGGKQRMEIGKEEIGLSK
jgi:hypothetical protein